MVRDERGSVLILMPVAAMVFLILGALAVDATVLFLAERELAGAAAAAANDAASRGIDRERFYAEGTVALDPALAASVATMSVAATRLAEDRIAVGPPEVSVGTDQVTVTLHGRAPQLFARALPGLSAGTAVSATATATATTPPP